MEIVIRYNPARGFEDAALIFARRLFAEFDDAIESLVLVPVQDDDLTVDLGGRRVYSLAEAGRPPRLADVCDGMSNLLMNHVEPKSDQDN